MQACLNPGGGINEERFTRRNEQMFEQTFEHLKCYANIIYNMYQTLTPFKKKGGCIT